MPGETNRDEAVTDTEASHETDVHNQIMDTVLGSMYQQFLKNVTLYADLSLLDPKYFNQVTANAGGFPEAVLEQLSNCLLPFDSEQRLPIYRVSSSVWQDSGRG